MITYCELRVNEADKMDVSVANGGIPEVTAPSDDAIFQAAATLVGKKDKIREVWDVYEQLQAEARSRGYACISTQKEGR